MVEAEVGEVMVGGDRYSAVCTYSILVVVANHHLESKSTSP